MWTSWWDCKMFHVQVMVQCWILMERWSWTVSSWMGKHLPLELWPVLETLLILLVLLVLWWKRYVFFSKSFASQFVINYYSKSQIQISLNLSTVFSLVNISPPTHLIQAIFLDTKVNILLKCLCVGDVIQKLNFTHNWHTFSTFLYTELQYIISNSTTISQS